VGGFRNRPACLFPGRNPAVIDENAPVRAGANMTNPLLFTLIVLFWFTEATLTAGAFAVPAAILDLRSTDASSAFILVRKGKGHGDGEERYERHRRHQAYGFSRHRRQWHGRRGFNGNRGFGNYPGSGAGNQNQPDGQN
jgi:hypothetical protein